MRETPFKLPPALVPCEKAEARVYQFPFRINWVLEKAVPGRPRRRGVREGSCLLLGAGLLRGGGRGVSACKYNGPRTGVSLPPKKSSDGVIVPMKAFCSEAVFTVLRQ